MRGWLLTVVGGAFLGTALAGLLGLEEWAGLLLGAIFGAVVAVAPNRDAHDD